MEKQTKEKIEDLLNSHRVVLFMKGTPSLPMCGFSARAVSILQECQTEFTSYNVLDDKGVRSGIKEYAQWPTIPQLYVNKELIGGSDIMVEMFESGELKPLLTH